MEPRRHGPLLGLSILCVAIVATLGARLGGKATGGDTGGCGGGADENADDAGTAAQAIASGAGSTTNSTSGTTTTTATPTQSLATPARGEWPMFKRDLAHTGRVTDMSAHLAAGNVCERWAREVTVASGRLNSGVVIGALRGETVGTVFVATAGRCTLANGVTSGCVVSDPPHRAPGAAYAIAGNGTVRWRADLEASADVYAPLLADVDNDGTRELVFPTGNQRGTDIPQNYIYVVRTEAEQIGGVTFPAGDVQTRYPFPARVLSEAAPVALDLDGDPALEVVVGTERTLVPAPGSFVVLDGITGQPQGSEYEIRWRRRDAACDPRDGIGTPEKADSSSPAAAFINNRWLVFAGTWDGFAYALGWSASNARLERVWESELPRDTPGCSVRKIRNGPVVGNLLAGYGSVVTFGHMGMNNTDAGLAEDFDRVALRVVEASSGRVVAEAGLRDWKSSPSLASLATGASPSLVAGRIGGVYALGFSGTSPVERWNPDAGAPLGLNAATPGPRSSPALADVNSDGVLDAIVGIEGDVSPGIVALDGNNGSVLWYFPVGGGGVSSSPAVGQLDGDDDFEIAFLGRDGRVHALDRCGSDAGAQ